MILYLSLQIGDDVSNGFFVRAKSRSVRVSSSSAHSSSSSSSASSRKAEVRPLMQLKERI
jgi:hypothetical protein